MSFIQRLRRIALLIMIALLATAFLPTSSLAQDTGTNDATGWTGSWTWDWDSGSWDWSWSWEGSEAEGDTTDWDSGTEGDIWESWDDSGSWDDTWNWTN